VSQSIQDDYDDWALVEWFLDDAEVDGGRVIVEEDGCAFSYDRLGFGRGGSVGGPNHVPGSHGEPPTPVEVLVATSAPIHHEQALGIASSLVATAINRGYPHALELADAFAEARIGLRLLNWPTPALQPLATVTA
jgi:hypothetical protein